MPQAYTFDYFGSTIQAESLGTSFVPGVEHVITAHCLPLTSGGEVVAVDIVGRGIDVPGGHIDNNESAVEAMLREVGEEAQITVENPALIDVLRLSSADERLGLAQKPYLLLYAAKVASMAEFVPNNETSARVILSPEDFIERYFGDKAQARLMIDRALSA